MSMGSDREINDIISTRKMFSHSCLETLKQFSICQI